MNYIKHIKPGDRIVSNFGIYQHWSIVTDNVCSQNKYMLISATERNGNVKEESWDVVTQGEYTYLVDSCDENNVEDRLSKARALIGKWKYSLVTKNCEHFVNYVSKDKMISTQVVGGTLACAVGVLSVKLINKKPNFLHYLLVGGLFLGAGVIANKATESQN